MRFNPLLGSAPAGFKGVVYMYSRTVKAMSKGLVIVITMLIN